MAFMTRNDLRSFMNRFENNYNEKYYYFQSESRIGIKKEKWTIYRNS